MSTKVLLKNVRLSFCELFEPKEYEGKERFGAQFHIEPGSANEKAIEAAITAEAKEAYGKNWQATLTKMRDQKTQDCFMATGKKGVENMRVLVTYRQKKQGAPGVFDNVGASNAEGKIVPNALPDNGRMYPGCYVNGSVEIYAQTGDNPGIRGGLLAVQYHAEGDAFSRATPITPEDFDAVSEGADAESMV
jgi:hypothetical protein